jgi:hypothetical protein
VQDAKENPDRGEVRFTVRSFVPGKPVALELLVPGRENLRAEVAPPADRGEAWVEFDLPEQ